MLYKVGDRIKIREDLSRLENYSRENNPNLLICSIIMEQCKGKEAFIREINEYEGTYKINIDGGEWHYSNSMIEGLVFKVGDVVKLREGCVEGQIYGHMTLCVGNMYNDLLVERKVTGVYQQGTVDIENSSYVYAKEMLELVTPIEETTTLSGTDPTSTIVENAIGTTTTTIIADEVTTEPSWTRFEGDSDTNSEDIKQYTKVLIPIRKTINSSWEEDKHIKFELENYKKGFMKINKSSPYKVGSSASHSSDGNFYRLTDLRLLNEGYTEGAIEPGRRIKTHTGKTFSFNYDFRNSPEYVNTEHYEQGFYPNGLFIRLYKELVTKPRGTVRYTMYVLLEEAEGKWLIEYDKAVKEKFRMLHRDGEIQTQQRQLREEQARVLREQQEALRRQEEEARRLRQEQEARERAERERLEQEEENKNGIWWHHNK